MTKKIKLLNSLLKAKTKESLDPSVKHGKQQPMLPGVDNKSQQFIGMSLGATMQIGDQNQYLRLDVWNSRWVDDSELEEGKAMLAKELIEELQARTVQCKKELSKRS